MEIKLGEHMTLIGMTGSGKTYFAKNGILPAFNRLIIFDTEEMDFPEFKAVSVKDAIKLSKGATQFYVRVIGTGKYDADISMVDELCYGLLKSGHGTAIYFDEITDYSDSHSVPDSLQALIRKARKRGISVITGTQRPQMLNNDFVANSVHQVYFAMKSKDIDHLSKYLGNVTDSFHMLKRDMHNSVYIDPSDRNIYLNPVTEYDWKKRLKNE